MASLGGSEFVFLCAGSMVSLALMGDGWGTWDPSNSFSGAALCHPCAACRGAAWGLAVSMAVGLGVRVEAGEFRLPYGCGGNRDTLECGHGIGNLAVRPQLISEGVRWAPLVRSRCHHIGVT